MKPRKMGRILALTTWDRLKVSFWFTPPVMSLGAIFLARGMHWVDMHLPNRSEALQTKLAEISLAEAR